MVFSRIIWVTAIFILTQKQSAVSAIDDENLYLYPGWAKSEKDLRECKAYEVCSIVHKRIFYPKSIERFCRCADQECPATWVDTPDNFTMHANNRAQMKFCEPITHLTNCIDNNETTPLYLTITNTSVSVRLQNEPGDFINDYNITSKASCYCPPHHKWTSSSLVTHSNTSVIQYRCAPLDRCKAGDFCGPERTDYYSVYYHCSCPKDHFCIRNNDSEFQAQAIFYDGPAYRAYCTAFQS